MASDLSNIIKDELANTLEQLLSKKTRVLDTTIDDLKDNDSSQFIKVNVKFDFKSLSSSWIFYVPTVTATKFEYFMLGGMGDLKEHIDDEIADAVNEIVSNVSGSISTSVNAQGYDDLGSVKFETLSNEIIDASKITDKKNLYNFALDMDDEKLSVYILFDNAILPYISEISGEVGSSSEIISSNPAAPVAHAKAPAISSAGSDLMALLGEDSVDNLKLLFDIKLKLSVRLGTKLFLLKDILRWDIGEIIELDQMVNEPLEILVNGVKIGEGEAVIVEGKFGLKIRTIGNEKSRLKHIGIG